MVKKRPSRRNVRVIKDISTVKTSKHHVEIRECLLCGWSPASIRRYLIDLYGEDDDIPSEKALQRWRNRWMPGAKMVPKTVIQKKLAEIDYKVDLVGQVSQMVILLKDRFERAIAGEENMGEYPLRITDDAAATYINALNMFKGLMQDLGKIPTVQRMMIDARTQILNQQNFESQEIDPGTLASLLATLEQLGRDRENRLLEVQNENR